MSFADAATKAPSALKAGSNRFLLPKPMAITASGFRRGGIRFNTGSYLPRKIPSNSNQVPTKWYTH